MDYEKKYNEALERAKAQWGSVNDETRSWLEGTFPELRESEDERIRKALYKMAKVPRKEIYEAEGITKEQALAYLEKQKEIPMPNSTELLRMWDEEDERILKGIYGKIDHDQSYNVSKVDMLNWLKSLRPSWKPSEEQMEALERAIIRVHSVEDIPILTELRNKLKAL